MFLPSFSSQVPLPEELDLLGTETALHLPPVRSTSTLSTDSGPSTSNPGSSSPLTLLPPQQQPSSFSLEVPVPTSTDMLVSSPLPTTLEEAFASQPPLAFGSYSESKTDAGVGGRGQAMDASFDAFSASWQDPSYFNAQYWNQPPSSSGGPGGGGGGTMEGLQGPVPGGAIAAPGMMMDPNEFDVSVSPLLSVSLRAPTLPSLFVLALQFDAVRPLPSLLPFLFSSLTSFLPLFFRQFLSSMGIVPGEPAASSS